MKKAGFFSVDNLNLLLLLTGFGKSLVKPEAHSNEPRDWSCAANVALYTEGKSDFSTDSSPRHLPSSASSFQVLFSRWKHVPFPFHFFHLSFVQVCLRLLFI